MSQMAVKVRILGRVQGVGYRMWLQRQAGELGIQGWCRNMPDGAVEAVLQGNTDAVKLLCNHCEHGPPHAEVIAVNTSQWEYDNTVFTFEVRR